MGSVLVVPAVGSARMFRRCSAGGRSWPCPPILATPPNAARVRGRDDFRGFVP